MEPGILEVQEKPDPICPPGGVIVNIVACGICSADSKMAVKGHRALQYPRILGHEIAGRVIESRTRQFDTGVRVQVAPGLRCGDCVQCRKGSDNQCECREIFGFTVDGGFAQYLAVPLEGPIKGFLTCLPENVGFAEATLGEPIACCINAQEKIGIMEGDVVLIVGAGPLGLLHGFVARSRGASHIIMSEVQPNRIAASVNFWADQAVNPEKDDIYKTVMEATDHRGADAIIFACSQIGLDERYVQLLAPGGRVSLFSGTSPPYSNIQLDSNTVHYHEILISGSYGCTVQQNIAAIDLIARHNLTAGELINHRTSLDNIREGLELTRSSEVLKSILEVKHG
jgi:L-iditol 2-dehydrogenase